MTALFTPAQVRRSPPPWPTGAPSYISVFAGRIADAGIDPMPIMREALEIMRAAPARGADLGEPARGAQRGPGRRDRLPHHHLTSDLLAKLGTLGKDLEQFSLETVQMFHRDAVTRRASSCAARARHRRRRLHRLQPRRRAARARGRGRRLRQLLDRPARVRAAPRRRARRGRRARPRRADARDGGLRHRLPPAANADVRHGLEHPRGTSSRTRSPPRTCSRRCARPARADRVLLDRLGLRRARGLPDARGRARSRSRPRSTRRRSSPARG